MSEKRKENPEVRLQDDPRDPPDGGSVPDPDPVVITPPPRGDDDDEQ
ncbi:MAG TPA: hypothetical protein VHC97_11240 [Thermoanaerobaculia bacterium]|jgi:hypothetical protein|nr:hypothetical protein [Thermoanaerobaculia bacterium]